MKTSILAMVVCGWAAFGHAHESFEKDGKAKRPAVMRELAAANADWMDRNLAVPFKSRVSNGAAHAWVEKWILASARLSLIADGPALIEEYESLKRSGVQDPLLDVLVMMAKDESHLDETGMTDAYRKVRQASEGVEGAHALAFVAAHAAASSAGRRVTAADCEALARHLAATVNAGCYENGGWELLVHQLIGFRDVDWLREQAGPVIAVLRELNPPEWAMACLEGWHAIGVAWARRGGGWVSTVTEDGWQGFGENLAKAGPLLRRSWELRPDRPEAATGLISIAMAGHSAAGASAEVWLRRAHEAVLDYAPATGRYITSLMPRWGGSHEAMLAFAKQCLDAGRFDSELPIAVASTVSAIDRDFGDLQMLYSHPSCRELIMAMSKGLALDPSREHERGLRQQFLAVNAWLCGEWREAAAALESVQGPLHPRVFAKLREVSVDEARLRGEVAILASDAAGGFIKGAEALKAGRYEVALREFEAIEHRIEAAVGRDFLAGRIAVARAGINFAAGDWVELPKTNASHGWVVRAGTWKREGVDFAECIGKKAPAAMVFDLPVGPNFAIKARVSTTSTKPNDTPAGIVFGDHVDGKGRLRSHLCNVWFADKEGEMRASYLFRNGTTKSPDVVIPPAAVYDFEIEVRNQKLTWKVNGIPVHSEVELEEAIPDSSRLGIGTYSASEGFRMKIEQASIKRLD